MSKTSLARPGRKGKSKCRTNRGRFMSLEAAYWGGRLTADDEARFERVCLDLHRLYKVAGS